MKTAFIAVTVPERLSEVPQMARIWWKKPMSTKAIDVSFLSFFCLMIYKTFT